MRSRLYMIVSAAAICLIAVLSVGIFFYMPHVSASDDTETGENSSSDNAAADSNVGAADGLSPQTEINGNEGSAGGEIPPDNTQDQTATQSGSGKIAYLTFDDGPSKLTSELLDSLNDCNVHATFFVVGKNAQNYPDILKEMVNNGDVIGIHSWTHDYSYIYKNTDNFLDDFNKLRDYIKETTGVTPNVCRFLGGTNNTVCFSYNKDHIMKSIVTLVEDMGFTYYDWNVSSGEANSNPPSKDEIISSVVSQCREKNTAVILFHDTDNQDYVDAVPEIVSQLSAMGFAFHTLSPDDPPGAKAAAAQFKPS